MKITKTAGATIDDFANIIERVDLATKAHKFTKPVISVTTKDLAVMKDVMGLVDNYPLHTVNMKDPEGDPAIGIVVDIHLHVIQDDRHHGKVLLVMHPQHLRSMELLIAVTCEESMNDMSGTKLDMDTGEQSAIAKISMLQCSYMMSMLPAIALKAIVFSSRKIPEKTANSMVKIEYAREAVMGLLEMIIRRYNPEVSLLENASDPGFDINSPPIDLEGWDATKEAIHGGESICLMLAIQVCFGLPTPDDNEEEEEEDTDNNHPYLH
jgi:hypothetical protein